MRSTFWQGCHFGLLLHRLAGILSLMSDDPLHQPHDKLFKAGFRDPANAAAFLKDQIPPALADVIAWEDMRLEPGTFVDSQFRESESDLLFAAPVSGTGCFLYILFEHQRAKDPWIALRLLRYMVRIWEEFLKKHPQAAKLPAILPVVLAQNAETWQIPTRFADLLDLPAGGALAGRVPDFLFPLIQLADIPFDKIVGTPAGILTLRVLKAEREEKLLGNEVWDEPLLARVPREIFEMILLYIFSNANIDKKGFAHKVKTLKSAEIKDTAMTLAQQFRQEGRDEAITLAQQFRQEGRQEGRQVALQEDIIEVLSVRFEHVPEGLKEAIGEIAEELRLRALHKAALRATTLESFTNSI